MEYQYCYSPYDGNVCNFNCRPKKASASRPRPHEINLRILVGVTGSVAAIKLGELIDCLYALPSVKEIAVIPTERSEHFINSEELESLGSKHKKTDVKVWRDADEWSMWKGRGDPVLHIDLGKWADAMILAPLDANTLAKISHGLCDNLLTCVLRAWDLKKNKPVLFCPAMNTKMWEHPLTSMQIQSLQDFGYTYVPPIEKTLMCGDTGVGAMATVSTIANIFSEMIEERYGHNSAYNQPTCFGYLSNQENAGLFIHNFGHSSGAHEHNNGREHWANCQNHTEEDEEERAYRKEESALYGDRSETSFNSAQEPRAPPNSGANSKDYRNNDQSQMQNEPRHSTGSGNSHENSSKRSSFQASAGSSKNKKDTRDDTFSSNSQGKDPDKNSTDGHGEASDGLTSTITSFNPVAHSTAITEGKAGQTSTFDTVLSGEDSKDTNSTSTSSKKTNSSKTKTNTKTTPTSRKPGNQSNQSQIRAQAQTSGAVSSNISSFNPVAHSTAIEGKSKGEVTTTSSSTLGSAKTVQSGKITKKKIAPAASQKPGNRSNQSKLQGNTNTFQTVSDQTSVEVSGISASSNTQESSGGSKIGESNEKSQGQTIHTSSSGETIAEVVATVAIHPKTGSVTSSKGGKSTQSSNKGSVGSGATEMSSGFENSTALGVEVNVELGLESSTFESDNTNLHSGQITQELSSNQDDSKKDDSEEQTTGGDIEVNTELSEIYVADLLKSGFSEIINLSRDFLDKSMMDEEQSKDSVNENSLTKLVRRVSSVYSTSFALYLYQIPYHQSLEMVLEAAQSYFDAASSYSDPDIDLAKVCLNLMQDLKEPKIAQMFDLIDAVKLLNKDFRMEILPLTVRLTRDKIGLVKTAMVNMKGGYKKTQQLLKLVLFLHPGEMTFEEAESLALDMAGDEALAKADLKFCSQICQNIVAKNYQTGWKMFVQLAKDQSEPPVLDHDSKLASINYALNMCPNDEIFNILSAKCLIEMTSLQSRVAELSPEENAENIEASFIEEDDDNRHETSTTPILLNPLKLHEFVSATSKLINLNPVKGVANVVRSGGGAIFESAKTLLKSSSTRQTERVESPTNESGWEDDDLDDLLNAHDAEEEAEDSRRISLKKESYPMIYFSNTEFGSPFFDTSEYSFKYDSFSDLSLVTYIRSNPSLELCLILDKMWHLERTVLGAKESAERNQAVVKQLVSEILPKDIPLGLAILFSVKEIDTLEAIFTELPTTPLALGIVLYSLSVMIQKTYEDVDAIYLKNPNMLISETERLIEENQIDPKSNEQVPALIRLFTEYKSKLNEAFG